MATSVLDAVHKTDGNAEFAYLDRFNSAFTGEERRKRDLRYVPRSYSLEGEEPLRWTRLWVIA